MVPFSFVGSLSKVGWIGCVVIMFDLVLFSRLCNALRLPVFISGSSYFVLVARFIVALLPFRFILSG